MLDLRSPVSLAPKIVNVMPDHGFCRCECEWKKTFENEADRIVTLCISFRSTQSEFKATFTFTDTAKVKLFTAENESSSKTAVSLDTHLVVIAGFGHRHLEYFIQDVDGHVFDRVSAHVRVSAHPGKILSQDFCNCKKSTIFFAD